MVSQLLEQILTARESGLARLSVDQYHQMIANGILAESPKVELLDGLLVLKDRRDRGGKPMNVGARHILISRRLFRVLQRTVENDQIHVRKEDPINLPPDDVPEPDISVVSGHENDYANHLPGPAETIAVMEVAESSLRRDRDTKLRIYADAGIEIYWIVDLSSDQIEVYSQPQIGGGQYGNTEIFSPGDDITFALPDGRVVTVSVSDVLP